MKKSGIYKLTFPNGKVYVGQSIDIKQRWYAHKCTLNKTRTPLINAINKYGWNNVIKDVL